MWEAYLFEQLNIRSFTYPNAGSRPFSHTIDTEDGCFVERGTEKRAGGVREMMLAKENFRLGHAEPSLNQVLDPKFITQPSNHRFSEDAVRAGERLHASQKKPLELDEGLLKKHHIVKVRRLDGSYPQAKINGVLRKFVIMFFPRESFFFGRGYELAVTQKSCSGVMKITGDTKYVHQIGLSELFSRAFHWRALSIYSRDPTMVGSAPSNS